MKYLLLLMVAAGVSGKNHVPEIFFDMPGVHVRDFALSAEGQELYMTMESVGQDASQIIKVIKTQDGWSQPEIASFSGQFKDLEPFLHPNGLQLFFASNRNLEQKAATEQFDIWKVERKTANDAWGKPLRLNKHINSADGNEFYPSVASNGNLYFTATKKEGLGKEDIYISRLIDGEYTEAKMLSDAINTASYEFNAYINPDETMLIFSSFGRKDGLGGGDLYISHRVDDIWQKAENLGIGINTEKLDYCPFYDAPNKTLYWTSNVTTLKSIDSKQRNYNQWYKLFTSGKNGQSKIYSIKFKP